MGVNRFAPTFMPQYIDILVDGDLENPVLKEIGKSDSIPYQLWYGLETRSFYPKASAAKIALIRGIVKFFGGKITYNDSTDEGRTYPRKIKKGESDKAFYQFQDALLKLKPLTQQDIDDCQQYAAY
jgi:hypothetical protein